MPEDKALNFATIHLDGLAHEWWYHGLVTLGHNRITTYDEFNNRLVERFDTKDRKLQFRELAQLKRYGSLETYISEF